MGVLECNISEENEKVPKPKTLWVFTFRSHLTTLICLGLMVTGLMRVSINMAMICMTLPKTHKNVTTLLNNISSNSDCSTSENEDEKDHGGTLDWSSSQQSQIFSAFFYGSIVGTIPSGFMADRFSPKRIFLACVLAYSVGSALTPLAASYHFAAVMVIRGAMGVAEGIIQPCVAAIVARWIPPDERATVIGVYTAGNQLCMVVGMPLFAFLCSQKQFLGGWPSIYYVAAASAVPWMVVWQIFITNSPERNKYVHDDEKLYVLDTLKDQSLRSRKKTRVPVLAILLSMPVWATNVACFASYLTVYMLQTYLPLYFKQVLNLNLSSNGFFSALPFLVKYLVKFGVGYGADVLTRSKKVSRTTSCKIFNSLSAFGPAVFFIFCSYLTCNSPALALLCLCAAAAFSSGFMAGAMTSAQAVAPQMSGVIRSWNGIFNQLSGVVAPYLVGGIDHSGTRREWQEIFFTVSGISVAAGIFYIIFASAEIQPWAKATPGVFDVELAKSESKISWSPVELHLGPHRKWSETHPNTNVIDVQFSMARHKSFAAVNPYASQHKLIKGRPRKYTV